MSKKPARDVESAVAAAQLYLGCENKVRTSDAQRLYTRFQAKVAAVAKKRSMDEFDAHKQIVDEARRRGVRCPLPGKDI